MAITSDSIMAKLKNHGYKGTLTHYVQTASPGGMDGLTPEEFRGLQAWVKVNKGVADTKYHNLVTKGDSRSGSPAGGGVVGGKFSSNPGTDDRGADPAWKAAHQPVELDRGADPMRRPIPAGINDQDRGADPMRQGVPFDYGDK